MSLSLHGNTNTQLSQGLSSSPPSARSSLFTASSCTAAPSANIPSVPECTSVDFSAQNMKIRADEFKNQGNVFFKERQFEKAVELYSMAINCFAESAVYWANRAFCHIKLENYGLAITDASQAINVDKSYVKGFYRRGSALFAQGKYKQALKDFHAVVKVRPRDPDARRKFKECKKVVREEAFRMAILSEESKPASERVNLESIEVSASYTGPRLAENGVVTLEFVQELLEHFKMQKLLHKKYVMQIVLQVIELLAKTPTLVDVDVPQGHHITVCGDVHGQYYDVLNIFKLNGMPSPDNPYLFNGDFVDRGSFSAEVIIAFFAFKLLYPDHFHMTRGNHESRTMNQIYGFQGELVHKYDSLCFELFNEAFCHLPLCVVLGGKVLVLHGGLFSEDDVKLDDIRKVDRNRQPPEAGLMCEILWSDPQKALGRAPSKRGVGLAFGPDVAERFLDNNGLSLLVRSHEVKQDGYEVEPGGRVVTIFSAPNYCDQMGNKGAFIRFESDMKPRYTQFDAVAHPPVKPMAYTRNTFGL